MDDVADGAPPLDPLQGREIQLELGVDLEAELDAMSITTEGPSSK